jgi:hypothetical protein
MRRSLPLAFLASALLVLAGCDQGEREPVKGFDPATEQSAAPADPAISMPEDAPPQEEADETPAGEASTPVEPGSCLSEIGAAASARLVQRCIAVSPATRPPCNAANACDLIQGEIDRSCAMYKPDETKPAECGA